MMRVITKVRIPIESYDMKGQKLFQPLIMNVIILFEGNERGKKCARVA